MKKIEEMDLDPKGSMYGLVYTQLSKLRSIEAQQVILTKEKKGIMTRLRRLSKSLREFGGQSLFDEETKKKDGKLPTHIYITQVEGTVEQHFRF